MRDQQYKLSRRWTLSMVHGAGLPLIKVTTDEFDHVCGTVVCSATVVFFNPFCENILTEWSAVELSNDAA